MANSQENIYLFDQLRKHACRSVHKFRDKPEEWESYVYACANVINADIECRLPSKVVKAVARSVMGDTYPNSPYDMACVSRFKEKQVRAAERSAEVRRQAAEAKKVRARLLKAEGYSIAAIVEELKVGKSSVYAWLRDR